MLWIEGVFFFKFHYTFCRYNSLCFYGTSHSRVRASEHGLDIAGTDIKGTVSERWYILVGLAWETFCMLCANACVHVLVQTMLFFDNLASVVGDVHSSINRAASSHDFISHLHSRLPPWQCTSTHACADDTKKCLL